MPHTHSLCRFQSGHVSLVINAPRILRRARARGHARDHRIKMGPHKRRPDPNFWIRRIPPQNRDPGQAFWRRCVGFQMLITSARPEQAHHVVTPLNHRTRSGHADRASRSQQKHAHRGVDPRHGCVQRPWPSCVWAPCRARRLISGHAVKSQQCQNEMNFPSCPCARSGTHAGSRKISAHYDHTWIVDLSQLPLHKQRKRQAHTSGFRAMQGTLLS